MAMEDPQEDGPTVMLCGPRRSGKTSILQVIFDKKSPHETLFLESTQKPERTLVTRNVLMQFTAIDYPDAHLIEEDSEDIKKFAHCSVLVLVIDAQEEPGGISIRQAKKIMDVAGKANPNLAFDVLIHKIDGDQFYSDEHKAEIQQEVHSKLGEQRDQRHKITFHCTSIYDHTIFEAFSRVAQRLLGNLVVPLTQSLDVLLLNSRMERAYLFDAVTKMYLATDPQPIDLQSYELCADMIDVVIDVSCIYGVSEDGKLPAFSGTHNDSSCIIHLNNGNLLYLCEVDNCLALVCILREENFDRQHLLDHNVEVFRKTFRDIVARVKSEQAAAVAAARAEREQGDSRSLTG